MNAPLRPPAQDASARITTLAANGPPPTAAGTLYPGTVMHARLDPFGHRFSYSVFSLLVDADRLADLGRMSRLLRVNRPGIVSFREADQTERSGETLRQYVDRLVGEAGLAAPARVLLLCYPRILGYVFNPISVYFCYGRDGGLVAILYAVRNTFGERHTYVVPIEPGDVTPAGVRQTRLKTLHVSPFMPMGARYHFRLLPPGLAVRLRIHETLAGRPTLEATFRGDALALTDRNLAGCLLRFPLMTAKVMAAIHWEALKIWLKGGKFRSSPPPPATASHRDAG